MGFKHMKKLFTFVLLLICFCIFAGNEYSVAGRTEKAPVIDGVLNDSCWKNAMEITNFIRLKNAGEAANRKTRVYLAFDDKNLYIGAFCHELTINPLFNKLHEFRAVEKKHDSSAIWRDDMMEIFLAPDSSNAANYYHLAFNSLGTIYDEFKLDSKAWTSNAQIAVTKIVKGDIATDDMSGWIAEIAIPFASMKIKAPANGEKWKANFCRKATSIQEISSWTQTAGRFHDPATFGTVEFRDKAVGVKDISSFSTVKSGYNRLSLVGNAPIKAELIAEFPKEKVSFSQEGKGNINIPFTLDPTNKAYNFSAAQSHDNTETFIRTGSLNFTPGETYTVTLRAKTNYTSNLSRGYSFFTIVQKKGGYQAIAIPFPKNTNGNWVTLTAQFKDKGNTNGTLWGIKWAKRKIKGDVAFDDISIIENKTGREVLTNGNFSAGSKNWNIFSRQSVIPGYGFGAESVKLHYEFKDTNGNLLYHSPQYNVKLVKENSQINSSVVQFGYDGLIPMDKLQICAGEMERVNLYLKSDCRDTFKKAEVTVILPEAVRLLPPDKNSLFPAPTAISEKVITRNGKKFRQYTLTVTANSVNEPDTDFSVAAGIPIYLIADTPLRGQIGNMEYFAVLDAKRKEAQPHILKLNVSEPPSGYLPSQKLPSILWVYIGGKEYSLMSREQQELLIRKSVASGYNMIPGSIRTTEQVKPFGVGTFPMMPSITLSGPYFPYASAFVKKHPEYAGVNAYGRKTRTVDPAVLLSKENPFRPYMKKVLAEYIKHFPNELHIDYEFPFMPRKKGVLPSGNAVNGFSARNLALFKKQYNISEDLTPELIFDKYSAQWQDFRTGQNAAIIGLYREIAREIKKDIRFSVYSGYPPHSVSYGIDWKKLSPQIDLCMVGYGGNDALMLKEIKQNFYNSGLLLMGHVDSTQMANTLTRFLCTNGSYMCYLHHTADGEFFQKSSVAAGLAAGFEPFFLDIRHTRNNSLTVDQKSGKVLGDVCTFRKDGKTVVIMMNTTALPAVYSLSTKGVNGLTAVQFSNKNIISHKNGVYQVKVEPLSSDAVYFCPPNEISTPSAPKKLSISKAEYPVIRWNAENPAVNQYGIRYAATEKGLASAKEFKSAAPYFQIPEKMKGDIFCQVRTIAVNGKASQWSAPVRGKVFTAAPIAYKSNPALENKILFSQLFSWGGGNKFMKGNAELKGEDVVYHISNKFDTTNTYWTLARRAGCHFMLPQAKAGENYYYEAKVNTNGEGTAAISISALDENGKLIEARGSQKITGKHNGKTLSVEYKIPARTKYINLFLNYTGIGSADFSNIKLIKR